MMRQFARIALAISAALIPASSFGQGTPTLPKAEAVFDQYVEATGGKAAYEKLKNRVVNGSLEMVGANVKGKVTMIQAAPDKMVMKTDLGAIGKSNAGTDGQLVWDVSTFTGERVLEGEEKDAFLLQALFNSEIRPGERALKAECVAIEDVEGKPAAKIVLTRKSGKDLVEYYDQASHLLVKQTTTTKGPQGELVIDQYLGDYRKEDGILMPHSIKQMVLGQEMLLRFDEFKHNVELAPDTFDVPPEIVKLQEAKAKAKAKMKAK